MSGDDIKKLFLERYMFSFYSDRNLNLIKMGIKRLSKIEIIMSKLNDR